MRTPAQQHQAGIAWVKMQEMQRKKMNTIRRGLCPKCYGSGRGLIFKCSSCGGTGRYYR